MIQNKVAESGIITFDIEDLMPQVEDVKVFDIAPFLFKGLILREKEFRASLLSYDYSDFAGHFVAVMCSADALIPMWAYMLIMQHLQGIAIKVYFGTQGEAIKQITIERIQTIDTNLYNDARVVVKGCGQSEPYPDYYLHISQVLLPHVKTLMYGEPCSTVPIYKKKKSISEE